MANDFKPFATGAGANVTPQDEYEGLPALSSGFQAGKASSAQINKALRQASFIAAALAQYTADKSGEDVLDDGDVAGFIAKMADAFGEDFQPKNDKLTAFSGLAGAANRLPYFTGANALALTALTSVGRDLIGKATVAEILTYLGLGDLPDSFGTAAGKDVGTDADELPTTSQADGRYGLKHWSSPGSTLVANTPLIINHGLDIDPNLCVLTTKLRCVTANNGYVSGDYAVGFSSRVPVGDTTSHTGNMGAILTETTVQWNTGQAGIIITPKGNGGVVRVATTAELAQWAFEFHIIYQ